MKTCSVEECEAEAKCRGMCGMHYQRHLRGQPLAGLSRTKFASHVAREWLAAMAAFESDECLPWPFSRTVGNGYARLGNNSAAKIMCEAAHGPAPEGKPFTRHLCGKGHEACMNPRHLKWGNRSENENDKIKDGTSNHGSGNGRARLTVEQVRYIRVTTGQISGAKLAKQFGVSFHAISNVRTGRTWKLDRGLPIATG